MTKEHSPWQLVPEEEDPVPTSNTVSVFVNQPLDNQELDVKVVSAIPAFATSNDESVDSRFKRPTHEKIERREQQQDPFARWTNANKLASNIPELSNSLGWINFTVDPRKPQPGTIAALHQFLECFPPSQPAPVAWIAVRRLQCDATSFSAVAQKQLITEWNNTPEFQKDSATARRLAEKYQYVSGKWMVFSRTDKVDTNWSMIAIALVQGELGSCAKVNPTQSMHELNATEHVICVYTDNFVDQSDVRRVRNALRRLGVRNRISYKPDIYTYLGIYRNNPWRIPPTLWTE